MEGLAIYFYWLFQNTAQFFPHQESAEEGNVCIDEGS